MFCLNVLCVRRVCAYEWCVCVCVFACVSVLVLQVYNVNPVPSQVGSGWSMFFSIG